MAVQEAEEDEDIPEESAEIENVVNNSRCISRLLLSCFRIPINPESFSL